LYFTVFDADVRTFAAPDMYPEFVIGEEADPEAIYNLWWVLNTVF